MRVNPKIDIYNLQIKEIILFDDGIQVKSQKAERQPKPKLENIKKNLDFVSAKNSALLQILCYYKKLQSDLNMLLHRYSPTNFH